MKNATKFSLSLLLFMFMMQACVKDIVPNPNSLNFPETTIYDENFDEPSVYPNLPTGWVAVGDSGWKADSTSTNSSMVYPGASGKNNISISNPVASGPYTCTLTSKSYSTLNYNNIAIIYGARRSKHFSDNGSLITSLAFSTDGGATWIDLKYTENPGDSNWYLINNSARIPLPASAANQASVMFRWTANIVNTTSGTYRIDDFQVFGTSL